jgi:hypothetical protein
MWAYLSQARDVVLGQCRKQSVVVMALGDQRQKASIKVDEPRSAWQS